MCHIDDFLADLANANKPRNTIRAYRGDLIAFAAHHDGEVAALTAAPVRAFLGKIAGQAPSTRKRKRAAVASFCRWAVRHDLLDASPMDRIDPIEGPKTLPRPAGVGDIAAGCGGHFRPHLRTSGGPTRDRQTLGRRALAPPRDPPLDAGWSLGECNRWGQDSRPARVPEIDRGGRNWSAGGAISRIWPQFRDAICRERRPFGRLGRLSAGLPWHVMGLLVVQRLSRPAVLPGVRGVIVARRRVLVMPGCR